MHIDLSAARNRRRAALALVTGPAVVLAGMLATPWEEEGTTAAYQAALAASPTRAQIAALLLFVGYALMALSAAAVLLYARSAPRGLRVAAGVAAFCGTTLSGIVAVDFYDLALAQTLPAAQAVEVADKAGSYPWLIGFRIPSVAGFFLGLVLLVLVAWRGRLVGAWAPVALVGSVVVAAVAGLGPAGVVAPSIAVLVIYGAAALRVGRGERPAPAPVAVPA